MDFLVLTVFEFATNYIVSHFSLGRSLSRKSPFLFFCIAIIGGCLGFISSYLYGRQILDESARLINLFATPAVMGALMHFIGRAKPRVSREAYALENFVAAFLFAFGFNLTRYFFT